MSYQAIIFDLDGTLLNTLADIGAASNRVLARRGFPIHATEDYLEFVGHGSRVLIERALPEAHRDDETIEACLAAYIEDYGAHWREQTELYPGIAALLDRVTAYNLQLAVLSNKPHALTQRCAKAFLSPWPFTQVWGQREEIPRKPDPSAALALAQALAVVPARCLFVGDSGVDMQTAKAAGMTAAGVLWGFRPESELRAQGAELLFAHPDDLAAHLDQDRDDRTARAS